MDLLGSTAAAAILTGRNAIAVETSKEFTAAIGSRLFSLVAEEAQKEQEKDEERNESVIQTEGDFRDAFGSRFWSFNLLILSFSCGDLCPLQPV